ncbi:MAG: Cell envelope integrity protein TolA [Pseudomonadota bacterium]|nr:Cell envelope integrity protein TolA [Pseudomonadota bacterium]
MMSSSYKRSFATSAGLHLGLLTVMLWHPQSTQAVLEANEHSKIPQQTAAPAPIQAVSVDAKEVEMAMRKLQAQKEQVKAQELQHQRMLAQQAQKAKDAKVAEMKHLQALKEEAQALKVQQAKMKQEAQKLAEQKKQQEQQLAQMKQKQQAEVLRLAKLEKDRIAEQEHLKKAKETELAKAEAARVAQAKALALAQQQKMAGEVDRYKALILNAIRDQWILPENIDPNLSSQFVIRLAPTGAVLDVHLSHSSGDAILDRSAQAAIYKASPLPVPHDVTTFNMFREITLTVRPSNARG